MEREGRRKVGQWWRGEVGVRGPSCLGREGLLLPWCSGRGPGGAR